MNIVVERICTCIGVSVIRSSVDLIEVLSNEIAARLKSPSRDNYRKVHYPRTQQRDPG